MTFSRERKSKKNIAEKKIIISQKGGRECKFNKKKHAIIWKVNIISMPFYVFHIFRQIYFSIVENWNEKIMKYEKQWLIFGENNFQLDIEMFSNLIRFVETLKMSSSLRNYYLNLTTKGIKE